LFELNQNSHTTLVLVTHDSVLAGKCQRQLHMQAGELTEVFSNSPSEQAARQVG
jgi:putative ABC transport system ATP-binding protein